MIRFSHKHRRGYTLMEMIVVIAIISIIFPALYLGINSLYKSHALTFTRARALVKATDGVAEVVRDVRGAVYAENGALPIASMATDTLTFYTDTDFDGTVERVRYFLNDTLLQKGVIEPDASSNYPMGSEVVETVVADIVNVQDNTPVFRYYTATGTEITNFANTIAVKRVRVELVASSRFGNKTHEMQVVSSAAIRNLKDVY